MTFPYRLLKTIQPLPSIYTAFPESREDTQTSLDSAVHSGTCLIRHIEDGIEAVPFERCNNASAPILSPDQVEKEVFSASPTEIEILEKPLPSLPRCIWQRMSRRQRILALLFLQFILLMVVGLTLMAARRHSSQSGDLPPRLRTAGNDSTPGGAFVPIQRGMFAVAVQLPQRQSSECLAALNESLAWQCAQRTIFQLNVLPSLEAVTNTPLITLGPLVNSNSITYGHQAPNIPPTWLTEYPNSTADGQTLHFKTTYDKVVYLQENDLSTPGHSENQPLTHHSTFQPGDTLWSCSFNDTSIQGYIYLAKLSLTKLNDTGPASNDSVATGLTSAPYVVELVEHRASTGPPPYCEKRTIQGDGALGPAAERIPLNLRDRVALHPIGNRLGTRSKGFKRRQQVESASGCECQWLIQ